MKFFKTKTNFLHINYSYFSLFKNYTLGQFKINNNKHVKKDFFLFQHAFYKVYNKYHYTRKKKIFKNIFNKKNFLDNDLEQLINVFLLQGKKKQLSSRINNAIFNIYDVFLNPENHIEELMEDFVEYPNYHEIKRLLIYNFD